MRRTHSRRIAALHRKHIGRRAQWRHDQPPHPALLRPDGTALRVLVVDDEQMLTDLLSMALRMEGWDVRTAGSGFQALQAAREFEPDAMVLDIMMPDLDGMAVLQRLRQSGNDVPVLFLTAKDAVGDRVAGLTAGGDDYVTKPFSLEEVVARLRGLMRRAGTAHRERRRADPPGRRPHAQRGQPRGRARRATRSS